MNPFFDRLTLFLLQAQSHSAQWNKIYNEATRAQDTVNILCWFLAAIFGLVGSLKVYNRWQLHSHFHVQITAEVAFWFGGCIFFIIAHFFIGVIFGMHGKGF